MKIIFLILNIIMIKMKKIAIIKSKLSIKKNKIYFPKKINTKKNIYNNKLQKMNLIQKKYQSYLISPT